MRWLLCLILLVFLSLSALAQETATPTPTQTLTPTPEPYVYATISPDGDESGQVTRFDYVLTAGDILTAVLLFALLASVWGMFVFWVVQRR